MAFPADGCAVTVTLTSLSPLNRAGSSFISSAFLAARYCASSHPAMASSTTRLSTRSTRPTARLPSVNVTVSRGTLRLGPIFTREDT